MFIRMQQFMGSNSHKEHNNGVRCWFAPPCLPQFLRQKEASIRIKRMAFGLPDPFELLAGGKAYRAEILRRGKGHVVVRLA